jgi:hypothetical protein
MIPFGAIQTAAKVHKQTHSVRRRMCRQERSEREIPRNHQPHFRTMRKRNSSHAHAFFHRVKSPFFSRFFLFLVVSFCSSSLPGFCQLALMSQSSPSVFLFSPREREKSYTYMYVLPMQHVTSPNAGRQLDEEREREHSLVV